MSAPKEANSGSSDTAAPAKSTLSVLKELRAGSTGFVNFYGKVWQQTIGVKPSHGILDHPMRFVLSLVIIIVGSIFFNNCQAQPMLPIFLVVTGAVSLSIQIIDQIAGSLLKDDNTTGKKAQKICIALMWLFLFGWFITGCVLVQRMPVPIMTHFPGASFITELMASFSTSSTLTKDQVDVMNKTMNALIDPGKHCAFPVYGFVRIFIALPILNVGYFVIVTVTTIVLYCTSQ